MPKSVVASSLEFAILHLTNIAKQLFCRPLAEKYRTTESITYIAFKNLIFLLISSNFDQYIIALKKLMGIQANLKKFTP